MSGPLRTNSSAVATHHPLATETARCILQNGGNAVDAAVAALATVCVVLSHQCGFGGYGGSMVIHLAAPGKTVAVDFDSRAPLAYDDVHFADDPFNRSNHGYLAVTVPAVIAGLSFALREYGTMTWAKVTERPIELADEGFPVDPDTRRHLEKWHATTDPVSLYAAFRDGEIPQIGQRWVQKDLANLLRRLAREGSEAFYEGDIPRQIVKQVSDHGGILAIEDFARYRPTIVEPLSIDYRGHAIITPPPPSGGITMLQILKTLEQFDLSTVVPWSAEYLHLVVEAARRCFADRARCLGDPDFVTMPIDELLSPAAAAEKAGQIRRRELEAGDVNPIDTGPHTSNVSIIDRDGNIVSLTATQGYVFGSRVVIDGLGLVMGHGMSRFDFAPAHPNCPAPGKRMHHNMSPTIALKAGRPFAAVGLPGGPKIITVTAQLLASLIDFGATARQAVDAPRVHTDGGQRIEIPTWADNALARGLEAMGHTLQRGQSVGGPPSEVAGPANAVHRRDDGTLDAASGAAPDAAWVG